MSSYIVEEKTINRIISFIYWGNNINKSYRWKFDLNNEKNLTKLGRKMLSMNIKAVDQRYNEKNERHIVRTYEYQDIETTTYQALKSLQCFLYQCSEGNVPKTSFYKVMKKLKNSLADEIIDDLPEYKKAEWG